jgi:histidine triad (HIT) family protein
MSHCIFCQIASGQAPASFVYEDDLVAAFMDINQPNPYKVLLIPREHRETIYDLDDDLAAAIFKATVKVARAIRTASGCDGLNIIQSNGQAGQQDVFHFHLHLLPRYHNDAIILDWDFARSDRDVLEQLAGDIRAHLQ